VTPGGAESFSADGHIRISAQGGCSGVTTPASGPLPTAANPPRFRYRPTISGRRGSPAGGPPPHPPDECVYAGLTWKHGSLGFLSHAGGSEPVPDLHGYRNSEAAPVTGWPPCGPGSSSVETLAISDMPALLTSANRYYWVQ